MPATECNEYNVASKSAMSQAKVLYASAMACYEGGVGPTPGGLIRSELEFLIFYEYEHRRERTYKHNVTTKIDSYLTQAFNEPIHQFIA